MSQCHKSQSRFFNTKRSFQYKCEEFSIREAFWHQWRSNERIISDEWLTSEWKAQDDDEQEDDEWLKCHQRSINSEDSSTVSEFLKRRSVSSYCVSFWQFFL